MIATKKWRDLSIPTIFILPTFFIIGVFMYYLYLNTCVEYKTNSETINFDVLSVKVHSQAVAQTNVENAIWWAAAWYAVDKYLLWGDWALWWLIGWALSDTSSTKVLHLSTVTTREWYEFSCEENKCRKPWDNRRYTFYWDKLEWLKSEEVCIKRNFELHNK